MRKRRKKIPKTQLSNKSFFSRSECPAIKTLQFSVERRKVFANFANVSKHSQYSRFLSKTDKIKASAYFDKNACLKIKLFSRFFYSTEVESFQNTGAPMLPVWYPTVSLTMRSLKYSTV